MKTYMAKGETLERKWYVVDADGLVLGRLASRSPLSCAEEQAHIRRTSTPAISSSSSTRTKSC